jgi:ribosomal protein S27AE
MKKCPKCGSMMTMGSPHSDGDIYQWECHYCGYIEGVGRQPDGDGSPTTYEGY